MYACLLSQGGSQKYELYAAMENSDLCYHDNKKHQQVSLIDWITQFGINDTDWIDIGNHGNQTASELEEDSSLFSYQVTGHLIHHLLYLQIVVFMVLTKMSFLACQSIFF